MTRPNRRAGTALIEFAGSLIVLTTLFTGIFQVSYTFYTYQRLENSVRAGARYASLRSRGGYPTDASALVEAVRNLVVYEDPAPAADAKPLAQGLTPANVDVIVRDHALTVAIRGFQMDSLFSKVKLEGRPTVTFPLTSGGQE